MQLSMSIKALAVGGLTAAFVAGATLDADAQERIKWKMASAWTANTPFNGESAVRFEANIKRMSGGNFVMEFFEPGALVPALECFDAVSKGAIESCWTTPGYHTSKYPALAFFTTTPFGAQLGEFMAWKMYGGGNELRDEIYAKHDMIAFDAFAHGPETSGWFRREMTSVDDLKGLKMRFFGLGARVMQKFGVSTQLLAGADIYPALERGVIDAAEYGMPTHDLHAGLYQIAKYNYFPGWHQQVSVSELLINRTAFNALPEAYKAMIEMASAEGIIRTYADSEHRNADALNTLKEEYGVNVKRWSDEDLGAFERAWQEVVAEQSAEDPLFKKVADSYFSFRERYRTWGNAQALQATYLTD